MKIGDQVRFLSETGGGRIAGFKPNHIVLVEDEDGFQIPTPEADLVLVAQDDYSMGKMIREKMDQQEKATAHAQTELAKDSRSVKALLVDGQDEIEAQEDSDPADAPITYRPQTQERIGGNRLSCYVAFLPQKPKELTTTDFSVYFVNDSNYEVHICYMIAEGNAWQLKFHDSVAPNTKLQIDNIQRSELGELGQVAVQLIAYKTDKPFLLKPTITAKWRLEPLKFFKLHSFNENPFFEEPALLHTIVEKDEEKEEQDIGIKLQEKKHVNTNHSVENSKYKNMTTHIKKDDGTLVVDLHASALLDSMQGLSAADILHYQLEQMKKMMEAQRKNHGQKIVFIHGKGEGVLRQAIVHELDYRYKNTTHQDASFQEYGYGATLVTIK